MGDGATRAATDGGAEPSGPPVVLAPPLWFLWTAAAVALPLTAVFLWWAAPSLVALRYRSWPVYALTHLVTLGWGSMTVMGSAYLMGAFLLGVKRLAGRRMFPWQFAAFTAGVALMVAGFVAESFVVVGPGGLLVMLSAWTFLGVLVATGLGRSRGGERGEGGPRRAAVLLAPRVGTVLAVASFALVTAWGLTIVHATHDPRFAWIWAGNRGLGVHLALGLGGWFGLMVVGVSYRLLPATHGVRPSGPGAAAVVGLVAGAVALTVAGSLSTGGSGPPAAFRAAALLVLAAGLIYVADLVRLLRRRRRRRPDLNVQHWAAVAAYTGVLAGLAGAWGFGLLPGAWVPAAAVTWVFVFLFGWVTQAILGQLYKISPFLMWYYRACIPDVAAIPKLPDVYAPRVGRFAFWATNAGTVLVGLGIALHPVAGLDPPRLWAVRLGAAAFGAGAAATAWMYGYAWIVAVLRGRLGFAWRDPGPGTAV